MLPEKQLAWGLSRSCIRELAGYGAARKAEIGADKVYDFSIGNPSVPAPECVNEAIAELIKGDSVALHGYTTAAGLMTLRQKLADDLNSRFDIDTRPELMYVTCGAAAGLAISLASILLPDDEVIAIAPFFPEYRVFTESRGGKLVIVQPNEELQIDISNLKAALSNKTKAVIINSPNNPSGAVYSEENIKVLSEVLRQHEAKIGETVYLISDEPYREIVYGDVSVACPLKYYDDSIMCYSFSESLSLPGERIGYIAVNPHMKDAVNVYASVMGSGRSLGFVNPPSLFQRVIERCIGQTSDISEYETNRNILCEGLKEIGYDYIEPQGAFYLFLKSLEPDAKAFSDKAKAHELLLVPSNDFGIPGYVRISYCVSRKTIEDSMPAFKALYEEYKH